MIVQYKQSNMNINSIYSEKILLNIKKAIDSNQSLFKIVKHKPLLFLYDFSLHFQLQM